MLYFYEAIVKYEFQTVWDAFTYNYEGEECLKTTAPNPIWTGNYQTYTGCPHRPLDYLWFYCYAILLCIPVTVMYHKPAGNWINRWRGDKKRREKERSKNSVMLAMDQEVRWE